jgi:hypothetical protein
MATAARSREFRAGTAGATRVEQRLMEVQMLAASLLWWLGAMTFIVVWVAIALWPARVAARKGHSFVGYFIFSLVFFPAALIVAYLVQDRRAPAPAPA